MLASGPTPTFANVQRKMLMTDETHAILMLIRAEPSDEIWQEAIRLSESIPVNSEEIFAITMLSLSQATHADTISALSTCLLEHLLEHDFSFFDRIEHRVAEGDDKTLYALSLCAKFGHSSKSENSVRWDALITGNQRKACKSATED